MRRIVFCSTHLLGLCDSIYSVQFSGHSFYRPWCAKETDFFDKTQSRFFYESTRLNLIMCRIVWAAVDVLFTTLKEIITPNRG